jgi:phosphatidylglycerol:prolipoprotein diacylglycerol transferase
MLLEPRIPYVTLPELVLVPEQLFGEWPASAISLKPFGILVATGVYLGAYVALRRGRSQGLDERALASFIFWIVGFGFVGAHVLDLIFYYPERIRDDPLSLLQLWDGLSSFGGFIGAILGMLAWRARHQVAALPYADTVVSALPLGWVFGRAGCAVVHDHPGVVSDAWYAVQFPSGGRLDLGLIEMLITIPLAVLFALLWRKRRPWGTYAMLICLIYAPLRFGLDFLRERKELAGDLEGAIDARYAELTPAQWACFLLFGLGAVLLATVRRSLAEGSAFETPRVPNAFRASGALPSDSQA